MIYPQKLNSKKRDFLFKFGILISVFCGIMLYILNIIITPDIPWAAIANIGIFYIWISLIYTVKKRINIAGHVLLHTILASLFTIFIDYEFGFKEWSLNIMIPIIFMISNITMFILTIISRKKYIKYAIYQLIIFALSFIPFFLLAEQIIQNKILCIIATTISFINFGVSLVLCTKSIKEVIIRKFHM